MAKRKPSNAARLPADTKALFVRLPAEEAEKIERVAFERKLPKKEVIRMLVTDHLHEIPPPTPVPRPAPEAQSAGHMVYVPYDPPDVLTAHEAAKLLQADVESILAMAERGEIPARKIGDDWRFGRAALLEWLGTAGS
jgi:excisionase family DNA binding protein